LSPEQQKQYVQEHPKTKMKPSAPGKEAPKEKAPKQKPAELSLDPIPAGVGIREYKLRVEGENAEQLAEQLRQGIKTSADLCKLNPPVCVENLGIPREDMPQLSDEIIPKFLASLAAKGIGVTEGTVPVGELKATQAEINAGKVAGMIEATGQGKITPQNMPIIISRDGYVLDGHHRWATLLVLDPGNKMKVHKVDMDARELVDEANAFEGVEKRDLHGRRLQLALRITSQESLCWE
jgi:hypothetical protein